MRPESVAVEAGDEFDRHAQPLADLAVGHPGGGQGDDLAFSVGQWQRCGDGGHPAAGVDSFELDRGGVQRCAVIGGQGGVRGGGARGPSTWVASWASRSATVRSPKQTAVCSATLHRGLML